MWQLEGADCKAKHRWHPQKVNRSAGFSEKPRCPNQPHRLSSRMDQLQLERIQANLQSLGIPAWLLYSFRDSNPIAARILGLTPEVHQSRRWAVMVPAVGQPVGLAHRIEPHIGKLMPGHVVEYSSQTEFVEGLRKILAGCASVAMEYSPNNAIPVIAKVDAGTVELVRSLGVEVVPSGDLIASLEAVLSQEQLDSAARAGASCREVMMGAFRLIGESVRSGQPITEFDVQEWILRQFALRGLVTDHPPNCSVGPNSANPHYQPTAESTAAITRGDFVLIDLWARERTGDGVYGDITWVGYVGEEVPEDVAEVFGVVRAARDAAFDAAATAIAAGQKIDGATLDDAARKVIEAAGYGEYFIHRTGHSITTELHGAGANLDNYETNDTRTILPGTSFSIEPGIYLPGRFGIRSELDVIITHGGQAIATSEPRQMEVVKILEG
ncbi:MAG: Xaa-Pro dipeptidase [Chlorobi bacterium OLB7]|nr:MAG: Xaa-Pro dipeptidase [Chlorobi bacterium OLB7]